MPSLEAIDDFLDEWGRLLDEGDSEGVLRLLEERTAAAPGLPPLEEVWASATAADDERAARRAGGGALRAAATHRQLILPRGKVLLAPAQRGEQGRRWGERLYGGRIVVR